LPFWEVMVRLRLWFKLVSLSKHSNHFLLPGQGFRDLFSMPMQEMRREDGRLTRGLHRGAMSFGTSTLLALVDTTQQFFSGIQVL
jgi:hypothetical protein